jgi:uncharacterized membrane protein
MPPIQVSLAAQLFASKEGFGKVGARPTVNNNPGDLRHAPGEQHTPGDPDGIGKFATAEEGWAALEHQLELYAQRGFSLQKAVYTFAPPSENKTAEYLDYLCEHLGCSADTPMETVLKIGGSSMDNVPPVIPWYKSSVQISQVTTMVSALMAMSPKLAAQLGLTTPANVQMAVEAFFGIVAFVAPIVGTFVRARSAIQPLTLTQARADAHPATQAATAAPLDVVTKEKGK